MKEPEICQQRSITQHPFLRLLSFIFFVWIPFEFLLIYLIDQITHQMNTRHSPPASLQPRAQVPLIQKPIKTTIISDDLQLISGIGPKTRQALIDHGISSFAQLARMDVDEINEILLRSGIRIKAGQDWIDQARNLS